MLHASVAIFIGVQADSAPCGRAQASESKDSELKRHTAPGSASNAVKKSTLC